MSKIKDWLFDASLDRRYNNELQPLQYVSGDLGYAGIKLQVKPRVEPSRHLPKPFDKPSDK